eukprot:TRINITY_DN9907_c0_g1_i1.p1 TRINITY_DN9907_c0_g1~~TRINITY_DN9907_c0_g1_i1.p1  ORF type:complete len:519 (-),score=86.83 TRINITY_DN9907_c0_g1_i1:8-1564(-)
MGNKQTTTAQKGNERSTAVAEVESIVSTDDNAGKKKSDAIHIYRNRTGEFIETDQIVETTPHSVYPYNVTYVHYQLRDNIRLRNNNELYVASCGKFVRSIDVHTRKSRIILNTNQMPDNIAEDAQWKDNLPCKSSIPTAPFTWNGWTIVSINVFLNKYLCVCGRDASFVLVDISDKNRPLVLKYCKFPGSMNNSCRLQTLTDRHRLIVCNNASNVTFQVYEFPSMVTVKRYGVGTLINGVSLSPNRKWIVTAGDDKDYTLIDLTKDYKKARKAKSFFGNNAVDWNSASTRFAFATRDGAVSVYKMEDPYNPKSAKLEYVFYNADVKPTECGAESNYNSSACGTQIVQWSRNPNFKETLVWPESEKYLHIADLEKKRLQYITMPNKKEIKELLRGRPNPTEQNEEDEDTESDGSDSQMANEDDADGHVSIAGLDLSVDGKQIFVGGGDRYSTLKNEGAVFQYRFCGASTLVGLCTLVIQANLSHWPADFPWTDTLPRSLLDMIFDPLGGFIQKTAKKTK